MSVNTFRKIGLTHKFTASFRSEAVKMYGGEALLGGGSSVASERTAFRRAEKRFKLYKSLPPDSRSRDPVLNETDLSGVVDFRRVLDSFERTGVTPPGIFRFDCSGFSRPVFCFEDRPGFYFIPSALTVNEQNHWIKQSLTTFPQPPNVTNFTDIYGPISDIFAAAQEDKVLVEIQSSEEPLVNVDVSSCTDKQSSRYIFCEASVSKLLKRSCRYIPASVLLRKLRRCNLGLHFDWCKREYDISLPHSKIPDALCLLAKKMAVPAMGLREEFKPEAAIVNYFGPTDMLGGHVDDMEVDWTKPIVSISLGCKAIFLLGGKSRDDSPVAMFLHSGDIVLMVGQARECFHGVPRIYTDNEHAEVSDLLSQLSAEENHSLTDYIKNSRININIRQVN